MTRMVARPLSWLVGLILLLALTVGSVRSPQRIGPAASAPGHLPVVPASMAPVAMILPVRWDRIERRVLQGIRAAVASFRFGVADRDEVVAIALERAWRAFDGAGPIRNPEAWGRAIAEHVSLDELRRQRRERAHLDAEASNDHAADGRETVCVALPGPFELVEAAERRATVRQRMERWPAAEQHLARLLMDGEARTVTEAARLYRDQEGGDAPMYPSKARLLLDGLRPDLEDLV